VTLAECCIVGSTGFEGNWEIGGRIDATLFGELQSRVVVSVTPQKVERLEEIAAQKRIPLRRLGVVGAEHLRLEGLIDLPLEQIEQAWRKGLEEALWR
jgi:phosphoribosylformylglycinamidine synthase